jgi:four helix bundle protein
MMWRPTLNQSYKDLRIWREAMDLAEACYRLSIQFPDEICELTAQVRRSAVSVPASIAEGCGCETAHSYLQCLQVAQGSLKALETYLLLADRIGMASAAATRPVLDRCDAVGKTLEGLIRALQRHGIEEGK